MSWLSEIFSPNDKKKAAAEAAKKKKKQEKEEKAAEDEYASGLETAATTGQQSAEQYFTNQGLDPALYSTDIANAIAQTRAGIPAGGEYGSAFTGIGEQVYGDLTNALRSRSLAGIEGITPPTIADTADDEIIAKIIAEQQGGAEEYTQNLLKRGVITDTGFDAAMKDILGQSNKATGLLSDLGMNFIGAGRSKLEDVLNQGRQKASNLMLGQTFDPASYGTNLQNEFDTFMQGLEGQFRAQAPTKLFDTSGLANIAGQAQGPQNLAFKPGVVGGYGEPEDEEEDRTATTVF